MPEFGQRVWQHNHVLAARDSCFAVESLQYYRWFCSLKKKASSMSMVGFPLLLIPIAIYNIIAFLMPGVSFADRLVNVKLASSAEWTVGFGDTLVALGVLMLLLEVIKGARPGAKYLTDHILSLIVFAAAAAEFLMWPKFATSTYFLLTLMAMADFLSGIALRARRSPQAALRGTAAAPVSRPMVDEPVDVPAPELAEIDLPPASEPQPVSEAEPVSEPQPLSEPVADAHPVAELAAPAEVQPAANLEPASEVASAASIAESVLMDHPEPKPAREPKIA